MIQTREGTYVDFENVVGLWDEFTGRRVAGCDVELVRTKFVDAIRALDIRKTGDQYWRIGVFRRDLIQASMRPGDRSQYLTVRAHGKLFELQTWDATYLVHILRDNYALGSCEGRQMEAEEEKDIQGVEHDAVRPRQSDLKQLSVSSSFWTGRGRRMQLA